MDTVNPNPHRITLAYDNSRSLQVPHVGRGTTYAYDCVQRLPVIVASTQATTCAHATGKRVTPARPIGVVTTSGFDANGKNHVSGVPTVSLGDSTIATPDDIQAESAIAHPHPRVARCLRGEQAAWCELWDMYRTVATKRVQDLVLRAGFDRCYAEDIAIGECFWDLGQHLEALKAYHFARLLVPEDERYERLHGARQFQYDHLQLHELERIMDINERNWHAIEARKPRFRLPPGRTLKIAYGKAPPPELPVETPIQYVPAEEADPWPIPTESWEGQPHSNFCSSGGTYIEDPLTTMKRIKQQNHQLMLHQETRKALVRY